VKTTFTVDKPTMQSVIAYVSHLGMIYAPHGVQIIHYDIYNGEYDGYRVTLTVDKQDGTTRTDDTPSS
jgi:glucose dehydrogenase